MKDSGIGDRALKYILKTEVVLRNLKVSRGPAHIGKGDSTRVLEEAKRYFEDAKYYFERGDYITSLASIAYCEGLLDALRMLRLAEFEW